MVKAAIMEEVPFMTRPVGGTSPMPLTMPIRIFVLRVTMGFMLAAALLSTAALLAYVEAPINVKGAYTTGLSIIITLVAAYHYRAIIQTRLNSGMSNRDEEIAVDGLRHSDWFVTLPLLVLKLYSIINNPGQDLILDNAEFSALVAMAMILLGAVARLTLDWGLSIGEMRGVQRTLLVGCYLVSCVFLVLLLIDLSNAQSGSDAPSLIWSFFLVWTFYPVVAIGSLFVRSTSSAESEWLSAFKDTSYAALDFWSKAVFAWWTASTALGVRFLDS